MEVKHPVKVTLAIGGVITTLNVMFSAGFVYSKLDQDWMELKKYKQKIIQNEQQIERLTEQNTKIISHLKLKDEQTRQINDKLNKCLAKKAVKLSYGF